MDKKTTPKLTLVHPEVQPTIHNKIRLFYSYAAEMVNTAVLM